MLVLGKYTPEEYAAMWGCDPMYDKPPRRPGDGYLFYNFGSERQEKTKAWLRKFLGAIRRTHKEVDGHVAVVRIQIDEKLDDLEGLEDLRIYVEGLLKGIQ